LQQEVLLFFFSGNPALKIGSGKFDKGFIAGAMNVR
jgi:hypothetical protein